MKTLIAFITVLTITASNLHAQQLENSTLWKISGNGLEQDSYLFGTIHITCNATLDDEVKRALDDTSQLVLELDMDDPALQTKMMTGMYMKDGITLKDLISEEDYALIGQLFEKELKTPIKYVQSMKPFFLYAMLFGKMLSCATPASYEAELMKVSKEQEEEVLGLETVEEQLNVFEDIPYKTQIKDLVKSAKDNLEHDKQMMTELAEIYEAENITKILEIMDDESYSALNAYQDVLIFDRNKKWIPKIEKLAKENATFFGVGAGHLAGAKGVINLLRKAGYEVTPVMN